MVVNVSSRRIEIFGDGVSSACLYQAAWPLPLASRPSLADGSTRHRNHSGRPARGVVSRCKCDSR